MDRAFGDNGPAMKAGLIRALRRLGLEPITIRIMKVIRSVAPAGIRTPHIETWRHVEPPPGHTIDSLKQLMLSFSLDGSPVGALDGYVHDSYFRFLHTWNLVRYDTGKCLELGGNPYFTSWLLFEHSDLDVKVANYFGGTETFGRQRLEWSNGDSRRSRVIDFDHFNMEESTFPYPDGTFDVVLYCEIIEHLLMNPVHTLRQIHRVLKPNGRLIITTPNVARLGNVLAMIDGRGIYDPYSAHGPYGRHNREYSMGELIHLLRFTGFETTSSFTADAHRDNYRSHPRYRHVAHLLADRAQDLGQYLFVSANASGRPRDGLPGTLFRSYPDEAIDTSW